MSKKLTKEEFIEKAFKVHGNRYNYDSSVYVNSKTKLIITCKEHGDFMQTPGNHCQGVNCPKCTGTPKSTVDEFIEKSIIVHGNKFNYDKVDYTNAHNNVIITCVKHGDFKQTPNNHLSGAGCIKCRNENNSLVFRSNTFEFISKSKLIHKNKYDYSNVKYIGSRDLLSIICPIHGLFYQNPHEHLKGNGCKKCGHTNGTKKRSANKKLFIDKAIKIHGNLYDYSTVVNFFGLKTTVSINCKKHGIFKQQAKIHLRGSGCPVCRKKCVDTNDFIQKSIIVHGKTYDYSKVDYIQSNKKVKIICKKHGAFSQIAHNHLKGNGCPICKESVGEKKIRVYLDSLGISYKKQCRFKSCKSKNTLPFDFLVFTKSPFLIEYQGKQHYEISYFSSSMTLQQAKDNLIVTQNNDRIKKDWCDKNKIPLLLIPYFKDIKEMINDFID